MFARFTRLPLHRCLHTKSTRPQAFRFTRAALGVSAATSAYLTWRLLSNPIALDSPTTSSSLQKPAISSKHPSKATPGPSLSDSKPEQSTLPDPEPSPERSPSSPTVPEQEPKTLNDKIDESQEQQGEGEEEPSQGGSGGAFNPETGEINWDCPCLGGMAHGPCGPEFREAFSCFVFSEQEPKGIDCVEKFKGMQDCFRRHPEVYSDEIMDDDEEEEAATASDTPEAVPVAAKADELGSPTAEPTSIPEETNTTPTASS